MLKNRSSLQDGVTRIFPGPAYTILICSIVTAFILAIAHLDDAIAQESSYIVTDSVKVNPSSNATAKAFCENGDGLVSSGYSISGFTSVQSASDTMVYVNQPLRQKNTTAIFEGWEAGLLNNGNATVTITAQGLCLDLTPG
jgi:hypothetical protein